jgi:hypothetical protein
MSSEKNAALVPPIRRARGYRLYDARGRKYIDLNLCGARAVLGHRPNGLNSELKNILSRGQALPMPSTYVRRLGRALSARYPEFPHVRILGSEADARACIARYLHCGIGELQVADPALGQTGPVVLDRPFLPPEVRRRATTEAEALLVSPPFRLCGCPSAVVFRKNPGELGPQSGWHSPLLVAGALKSLHDLERHRLPCWYREDLLAGTVRWRQCGIYFSPAFGAADYDEVFRRFLDEGALLSTDPGVPSVLPGEVSPGELAMLMRLLEEA